MSYSRLPDTLGICRVLAAILLVTGFGVAVMHVMSPVWTESVPGWAAIHADAALCFGLLGVAIFAKTFDGPIVQRVIPVICAVAIVLLCLGSVDTLLQALAAGGSPDTSAQALPMPVLSVAAIVFGLCAVLLHEPLWRAHILVSRVMAYLAAAVGTVIIVSRAYGANQLFEAGFAASATSIPAGIMALLVAAGVIWLDPRLGLPAILGRDGIVGSHIRALLPVVVGAPLLVGGAVAANYSVGMSGETSIAITALGSMAAALIIAVVSSSLLRSSARAIVTRDQALAAAPSGVFVADTGRIVYANDAFIALTGTSRQQTIDRPVEALLGHGDTAVSKVISKMIAAARDGEITERDLVLTRADQERFWGHLRVSPVTQEFTDSRLVVGVLDDISERRRNREQLETALAEAERAKRVREQFLRIVSHEMRTPMNSALTWARLMQMDDDPETRTSGLDAIIGSIETQDVLLDDLLDLSAAEQEVLSMEREWVDLAELTDAVVQEFIPVFENGRNLAWAKPAAVRAFIDPTRVTQILRNLLTNARKYAGADANVVVTLTTKKTVLNIAVSDDGAGMDEQTREKVFDAFWRAGSGPSGLGIGLSVSKALAEAHGGHLSVSSAGVGHGTTFTLELPLAHKQSRGNRSDASLSGMLPPDASGPSEPVAQSESEPAS